MGSELRLRSGAVSLAAMLVTACGGAGTTAPPTVAAPPASGLAEFTRLAEVHAQYRVAELDTRRFQPEHYAQRVDAVVGGDARFVVSEAGRSVQGRAIRRIDFGGGPITVLLWSQMHGNESTASRALVDVMNYLATSDDPGARAIEQRLAVTMVPVLNPDGAARFVRQNAIGVDINRDARALATPEARVLKGVRDQIDARWGFNLHDQNVRTRLGASDRDVRIALLAPPPGYSVSNDANRSARRMCSYIARAIAPVVGDQVARYDESFNPRAFGDLMTSWGTSTVLIESGGELSDPHKERLRTANFVAIVAALTAIAEDTWVTESPSRYLNLPLNAPWVFDLLIRGGTIALPGHAGVRADIAINFDDTLARSGASVAEVGDLAEARALETIDAEGLYVIPSAESFEDPRAPSLTVGYRFEAVVARDPAGQEVVRSIPGPRTH